MNHLIRWLLRLYPRTWRDRYGEEFAALLESQPLNLMDVFDVMMGALDARWLAFLRDERQQIEITHEEAYTMQSIKQRSMDRLAHIAGIGAFISALTFLCGLLYSFTGPQAEDAAESLILFAPIALLPAVIALSRIFGTSEAGLNVWAKRVGVASALSIPLGLVIGLLSTLFGFTVTIGSAVFLFLIGLGGVWMILTGFILGERLETYLQGFSVVSIFTGMSWIFAVGSTILNMVAPDTVTSIRLLMNLNILALIVIYPLYTVWLGVILYGGSMVKDYALQKPITIS